MSHKEHYKNALEDLMSSGCLSDKLVT